MQVAFAAFATFGALDARSVLAVLPAFTAFGCSRCSRRSVLSMPTALAFLRVLAVLEVLTVPGGFAVPTVPAGLRGCGVAGLRGCGVAGFTVLAFEDLGAVLTPLSWPMSEIFSDGLGRPFSRSGRSMTMCTGFDLGCLAAPRRLAG
ncbi:hypothetical protein [Nonomuraea sp. NPDC003201]